MLAIVGGIVAAFHTRQKDIEWGDGNKWNWTHLVLGVWAAVYIFFPLYYMGILLTLLLVVFISIIYGIFKELNS